MNSQKVGSVQELHETLNDKKVSLIFIGCMFLMLSVAAFGLSLSTIQQPLLDMMNESDQFSLTTVLGSIALCIMTPVGGTLMDRIGTRKLVLYSGLIGIISALGLAFTRIFILWLIFRFILSCALGAFVSAPYLLVREIYPLKLVPSKMGWLTAALSGGGLIGSFFAGLFMDNNMIALASCFPAVFLAIGIPLVYCNLPDKEVRKTPFDYVGFILMSLALAGIFLGLNYGPKLGWASWMVLAGILFGIACTVVFIIWEKSRKHPLIPMSLFSNKQFSLLLVIGILSIFYLNAMNAYAPLAVQTVMGQSASVSGLLQVPRAIVTIVCPAMFGAWIVRKKGRTVTALAIAMLMILIPFLGMVFVGPAMPVWFVMFLLALNGIGDSFRSVSLTPAAQALLKPEEMGIGTSLIGFVNSLAGVIASSLFGIVYDALVKATPGIRGQIDGLDTVFLLTAVTGAIGLILVLFVYKPMTQEKRVSHAKTAVLK